MSERITHTAHDDAPLSAAKRPEPSAADTGGHPEKGDVLLGRSVTVNRPREELYAFWRDFKNLPRFMHGIQRISILDPQRSQWTVEAPGGRTAQWTSRVTEDRPGELIAWQSEEGAQVRNSGRVEFKDSPEGRGTVVTVTLVYDPPGGTLGELIAKLFQKEPKIQARRDLRRFKQLMETGEIATAAPPDAAPRA